MLIPPKYHLNEHIVQLLQSIEACRDVVDAVTMPPEVENNIRRASSLKSSVFSARIEGNPLTVEEFARLPSRDQRKAEIVNIMKGISWIAKRGKRDVLFSDILELHEIAMHNLSGEAGRLRTEHNAIFNAAGIAIYMPPSPVQVKRHLERLLAYTAGAKERFGPIKACLAHYVFEKIHPFLDGNGRVGRLLLQKLLTQYGYGMKGLLPIEEYMDNHRSEYYRALEEPEKDATDYVLFMLGALMKTAQKLKEVVIDKQHLQPEDYLLPRRAELLTIIREHKLVSFDQLRRRFIKVNARTLRYDLKKLQDSGFIRKRGATKGVYYEAM